ncbi:MAG: PEP-CTERM sorting domain-containing protein [Phycisphaerae bacterium]
MRKASILAVVAVALVAGPALGATITIKFNGTDGQSSCLWWAGWSTMCNTNTGAEPGRVLLSRPGDDWYFPAALLMPVLPADFAGATVNSATLAMKETWWNGYKYDGVELHNVTQAWTAGNGTAAGRWGPEHSGAGKWFSNYDATSQTGVDWQGNTVNRATALSNNYTFDTTAMGTLIDTQNGVGNGARTTFDVLTWAQNIASGAWANNGLAIWMGNAVRQDGLLGGTLDERFTAATTDGLTIDYTPIPEPATVALLAFGGLGLLRRRK